MRDLLLPSSDDRVVLRRENGTEVLLFELVAALSPRAVNFLPAGNKIRVRIHFDELIDAIALDVHDEMGAVAFSEIALRYRPVATKSPDWFQAEVGDDDANAVEITIGNDWFEGGVRLARMLVRPDGCDGWRPLRNTRGDTFAIVLSDPRGGEAVSSGEISRRFESLSLWLSDCYADECWPKIENVLVPRWEDLGRRLKALPGGEGAVMRAASLPPPDHVAPGWVPILHPLHFLPGLYAAPPKAFALLSSSNDPGVAEMSALATLDTVRLRQLSHLHPTVYLAFGNVRAAQDKDVRLEGFDPVRFFSNLPLVDSDHAAGWFWRGTPLLGPDHWRAAHLRLVDRLDAAGLFLEGAAEDGPNSLRQGDLQRLMHAAWISTARGLRPPAPLRSDNASETAQVDLWSSALLSGFAQASRFGDVEDYLKTVSLQAGMSTRQALTSLAFMLRLAPELFAFHLLLWQIAKERP